MGLQAGMKTRSLLRAVKTLSMFGFCCALAGLFIFGNYLLVDGHRPPRAVLAKGFTFPIPGKGAPVYVSTLDLIGLVGLVSLLVVCMMSANWAYKKLR